MPSPPLTNRLYRLARSYGVQTAYYDVTHRRRVAPVETLLAILKALGAPVNRLDDVPNAERTFHQYAWRHLAEPVVVTSGGAPPVITLRLPDKINGRLTGDLTLESGESRHWSWTASDLPIRERADVEGVGYTRRELRLAEGLPDGYHHLRLGIAGQTAETLIIAAPARAYEPPEGERDWGLFLPQYALHTRQSWGAGDYGDLGDFLDWTARKSGQVLALLPLLPTFLEGKSFEPSPYRAVSRLFWSEFYLNIPAIPEFDHCQPARALVSHADFQQEIAELRQQPLVDYHRQMRLKRRVLEALTLACFNDPARVNALESFVRDNPSIADYARFRAVMEKREKPWPEWPAPLRDGTLGRGDYDETVYRYYLYTQWQAGEQVTALAERARRQGVKLYLDLPLGVHPGGYDAWREQASFTTGISAGAPPDIMFTGGQDWAFPPLHPERVRDQGYRYVINYLHHHMKFAGILRIDHVMGLHRLFWIPHGMTADRGTYVRYPAGEFYAILKLESQRHRTIIAGEDLGTVPREVEPAMAHHGLSRLYVVQYELAANRPEALPPVFPEAVASLNTHDMPPFTAFWSGRDIGERVGLGLLDKEQAGPERTGRRQTGEALLRFLVSRGWLGKDETGVPAVIRACLRFLAASRGRAVLVNLEDLWGETAAQNMPGSHDECPNWRQKACFPREEFDGIPGLAALLEEIARLRRR